MPSLNGGQVHRTVIAIGGLPIAVSSTSASYISMLERSYAGFVRDPGPGAAAELTVEIVRRGRLSHDPDDDLQLKWADDWWTIGRGDFEGRWNPVTGQGWVRQSLNPYSIDSLLRVIHSLLLASRQGFLLHAASAVRKGKAFVFSGVSGSGKTTIARLAPADVTLLTDEISYVRRQASGYHAYGTPFSGELAAPGANIEAPIAGVYFLRKGDRDVARPIAPGAAVRALLRNVLFFAQDVELVGRLFATVCQLAGELPAYELTFRPQVDVWNLLSG